MSAHVEARRANFTLGSPNMQRAPALCAVVPSPRPLQVPCRATHSGV